MSAKKGSPATSNTLFKYFNKSPAITPKQNVSSPSVAAEKKVGTPTGPKVKRPIENGTPKQPSACDDDDEIIQKTKKRRILMIEDSSDEENVKSIKMETDAQNDDSDEDYQDSDQENSIANGTESESESPVKKPRMSSSKKSTQNKSKKNISIKEEKKFDLKTNIKTEKANVSIKVEESAEKLLDEPTIWPHTKLDFLKPEHIKDAKGHRMNHPDYNPRTLYVPDSFMAKQSPGMRQWWQLKSQHLDCVLFFKVGKFYELYHMDAGIGVQELGFTFMRGEFAHTGFPEIAYDRMSTTLVERGYKVARVEQTETPDMMADRCKSMKGCTKFDRVVKREICQVTNKGTQVFGQQVQLTVKHELNYMLSIVEKSDAQGSRYGVCYIDTSIGDFHLGEFSDDKQCSRLLTLLAHNPPVLILFERSGISPRTSSIFKTMLSNAIREPLATDTEMWNATKTLKFLAENYFNNANWPDVIKSMQDDSDHLGFTATEDATLGLKALGGCIWYMKKCYLDQQIMSMARYHLYVPPDNFDRKSPNKKIVQRMNKHMVLDSITISNLKITGDDHSLLGNLDSCCTKFGKRMFHYWICSPSCEMDVIRSRQEAVTEMLENNELLQNVRQLLGELPDLERLVAQIHTFGNRDRLKSHPDGRAIFFEDKSYSKKKINDFILALKGFEACTKLPGLFEECQSEMLMRLSRTPENSGEFPNMTDQLDYFENAFDHEEAKKEGVIAPGKGIDEEFDSIEEEIVEINQELKAYLKEQEKYFGCRISYFGNDKKRFQLEVPESNSKRAGSAYSLETQRKGAKRYHTDETRNFCKRMISVEERRNYVLKDLSRRIFEKFSKNFSLWKKCYEVVGTLDVLASLAEYARNQGNTCIPEVVEPNEDGQPIFEIDDGYHPCMNVSDFIPNGIKLGGDLAPLALLTGPNMGGKSTLMRQVGLIAVMVQIGSRVPANSCRMSLIDRIFTRLGAQDDIMAGQSTFLVELSETSAILKHATLNSLVLLDELGRGTATYDGTAIAASVVNFLADLGCRSLFSTHYHSLVDNFHTHSRISLGHMACLVENDETDDPTQETVTFLYKYTDGPCPKSYGFNAAKLAGMPHTIIKRAYDLSKSVESAALKKKLFSKVLQSSGTDGGLDCIKEILLKLKNCSVK